MIYFSDKNGNIVQAKPIARAQYYDSLNLHYSSQSDLNDNGYMVIVPNKNSDDVENYGGSVSWIPENIFLENYQEIEYEQLSDDELDMIENMLENEGFDYVFTMGSSFEDITNPEFHRRIQLYLDAKSLLEEMIFVEY